MSLRKSKPDPIFALIAAHAKAVKVQDRADRALQSLNDRLDKRKDQQRLPSNLRLTSVAPYLTLGPATNPASFIRSPAEIKRHVWGSIDGLAVCLGPNAGRAVRGIEKEAVAELERRFDRLRRAHRAARKACGITARQKVADDAQNDAMTALQSLTAKPPASDEGKRALAKHMAALDPGAAPWWSIRRALENLA